MSIKSEAQISAALTANFIDASQQSVSGNSIFYLVIEVSGSANLSGSYSISSISTYLSGYGIPSYSPPEGTVVSKPYVLNDTVYFIYAPNITSINPSSPDIKYAYLASVDYSNGIWGNLDLIIDYGFTEAFSLYKGYIYAIWYPNISSSTPHLIVISPSHQIIYNNTIPVNNVILICVLSSDIIAIANSTGKLSLLQLSSGSISSVSLPPEQLFIYNLSTKALTHVPNYKDIEPTSFQRVNNHTFLIDFSSNSYSYIAEYNVLNDSIYNVKQVPGTATVSYYNGLVAVSSVYRNSQTQYTYYNYVFKLSDWSTVYFNSGSTTAPSISLGIGEALVGNSTIYLFTVKVDGYIASLFPPTYQLKSSPSLVYIGGTPQPFSIHSNQEHYNGYTLVTLYWSESVPSTYSVFVNGTLLGSTTDNIYYLNFTKNETAYITVEAQNSLGSINESVIIHILVYKEVTTSITTTTEIPSNTTTSIPTTASHQSTTSSTTYPQTVVNSTTPSTSTIIPTKSANSSKQLSIPLMYPVEIIIVVITTIAIALLVARKK
jgi:hypothetical protein